LHWFRSPRSPWRPRPRSPREALRQCPRLVAQWSQNPLQRTTGGNSDVYAINADGTDETQLTFYAGNDLDADRSPDGQSIAFEREPDGTDGSVQQVFVLDLKTPGAPAVPMTFWPSVNGHPGWAHGRAVTGAVRTQ